MLTIKKIMYKPPATIVFWDDGTKTVSVCERGDAYNKELGFALCVLKKKYGNKKVHQMLDTYVHNANKYSEKDKAIVWENKPTKKKVILKKPDKAFGVKTFNSFEDYVTYVINDLFALEDE